MNSLRMRPVSEEVIQARVAWSHALEASVASERLLHSAASGTIERFRLAAEAQRAKFAEYKAHQLMHRLQSDFNRSRHLQREENKNA